MHVVVIGAGVIGCSVAYHLAHYLSMLLVSGQFIIPLVSDPFGLGWDLFGTARAGEVAVQNVVPRMSATPGGIDWLGPAVGAHNAEIYGGLLGIEDERLEALSDAGVI